MKKNQMEVIGEALVSFKGGSRAYLMGIAQHRKNKKFYLKLDVGHFHKLTDGQAEILRQGMTLSTKVNDQQIIYVDATTVAWPSQENPENCIPA